MTVAELRDLVKRIVMRDDFDDAFYTRWVVWAHDEVQKYYAWNANKARIQLTWPAGADSLALPDDVMALDRPYGVYVLLPNSNNVRAFIPVVPEYVDHQQVLSDLPPAPQIHLREGYPITLATPFPPDEPMSLEIRVLQKRVVSNDSDSSWFSDELSAPIVHLAAQKIFEFISDPIAAQHGQVALRDLQAAALKEQRARTGGVTFRMGGGY